MEKFFETASFHIVKPCNMKCKFCYATFEDQKIIQQLPKEHTFTILKKLKDAGLEKITFAGGEPMLYKHLDEAIEYSKQIGLVTSIITNGSLITEEWLDKMVGTLDWVGVSIDSLDDNTNRSIGRVYKGHMNYVKLCNLIKSKGFKLKINTVVNKFNENEDMNNFINYVDPLRWKIFDTLRVEGQNDSQFDAIKSSPDGFTRFIGRHKHITKVPENNQAMSGSYLLINPQGRFYENWGIENRKSDSLVKYSVEHCLSQISLNRETFLERGGVYNW